MSCHLDDYAQRVADIGPALQGRLFPHAPIPAEVLAMRDQGALFVINDSAGADSQAMKNFLRRHIPARQLLIVHAEMRGVQWDGTMAHIERYSAGLPIIVARAKRSFWDLVEARGMFPSAQHRQCTSDLKRGPIEREVRRYLEEHPEFNGLVVNCMGLRADESVARSRRDPWSPSKRNSKAGRQWFDWCPIFDWTKAEVFEDIAMHQQQPFWTYRAGMSRCSCVVCVMASQADLKTAARLAPEVVREYIRAERRLNFTVSMNGRPLSEITGLAA